MLYKFCRFRVCHQQRNFALYRTSGVQWTCKRLLNNWRVDIAQNHLGARAVNPNDNSVWMEKVFHGGPLPEKLWVRCHIITGVDCTENREVSSKLCCCLHRNCTLLNYKFVPIRAPGN